MQKIIFSSWPHISCIILLIISVVNCSPPDDPIHCTTGNSNCTIRNSYGAFPDRSTCRAAKAIYPTSEAELISAVAKATMARAHMKVGTRTSHSVPKLMCPRGQDGIVISTKYLDRVVEIDVAAKTMTVESGVTLKQVIDEAAKAELALPYSPYWWGLTVGGMMGTGAHGSSLWGLGSQVHDYVVRIRIVTPAGPDEGYAMVRTLESGDSEMDAAKVSLGVLGVISQVTLKLQPLFKRSVTYVTEDDDCNIGDVAVSFGRVHEFADITWYPSKKRVVYRIDDRVSVYTSGNGVNNYPGFSSRSVELSVERRFTEEMLESLGLVDEKCIIGEIETSSLNNNSHGLTNDGISFTGYPVIGYQNHMQASGTCLVTGCPWDPRFHGLFFHQTTLSIALSKVKGFIDDIKKLVALEPKSLCGLDLYIGIVMRYVTASSAYLGKQEEALDFDILYYRSRDPLVPRLFEDIMEEIEQIAVFKYDGLPHWGKNRNVAFIGAINKYKNGNAFLKVKARYDPLGLFSSEWTDQILGLRDGLSIEREGCALEGLCVCSQDIHCAPNKGYLCRPGKVYDKARVCAKVKNEISLPLGPGRAGHDGFLGGGYD
ncbi:l-gulonolactone oxidase [Phtheirospermum japonicum]|uniref:L-gulonolactone oxidase n=1 Tax=Phtheirospermum japonicum TaxID=374723 RepID=A0A830D6V8_9LAMI|nr:l-gulonolactone oxidase [Phtheirospermum japonicum]